jgi:phosphatidylglycerol:prolipoprotein diacylglycerol transferase
MLIHPMPDPVAFAIGPLKLHWYGLAYVAAFAQLLVLCRWRLKHPQIMAMKWSLQEVDSLLIYAAVGVFAGARLGEVLFYHPLYFLSHPLEIFQPWKGGMSFHGGLVGVLIMMWLWGRKYNRHPFDTLDFIAPMVPLGLMFGRLGNFINAELHGRVADPSLPWAMIWPNVDNLPRHPSPLYEALAEGLVFFILLWLYSRKARPRWAVVAMFGLLYACARFVCEYFRVPDYVVPFAGFSISAGQMLCLPMIAISGGIFWLAYRKFNYVTVDYGRPDFSAKAQTAEPHVICKMAQAQGQRALHWMASHVIVTMVLATLVLLLGFWTYELLH